MTTAREVLHAAMLLMRSVSVHLRQTTSHPLALVNAWAEDVPHESLPLEDVFANAPAREGDLFRVPPTA